VNKKAIFFGFILDLWGWIFFILGVLFWILIFTVTKESVTFEVSAVPYTADDVVMFSYLKTPVSDGVILDTIFNAYRYDDKAQLSTAINKSLNLVYGRAKPVCWKLWYYEADEKELLVGESCGETAELFDKELIVPLPYNPDKKNIKIRLTVPGYK